MKTFKVDYWRAATADEGRELLYIIDLEGDKVVCQRVPFRESILVDASELTLTWPPGPFHL